MMRLLATPEGDIDRLGSLWDDDFIVNNPFNVVGVARAQVLEMVR